MQEISFSDDQDEEVQPQKIQINMRQSVIVRQEPEQTSPEKDAAQRRYSVREFDVKEDKLSEQQQNSQQVAAIRNSLIKIPFYKSNDQSKDQALQGSAPAHHQQLFQKSSFALDELEKQNKDSLFADINDKQTDFYFLSNTKNDLDQRSLQSFRPVFYPNIQQNIREKLQLYGRPTALTKMRQNVFIGMSGGLVFGFYANPDDKDKEKEKTKILAEDKLENGDPISCISATMDAEFLLIGYMSGDILVVQIKSGKTVTTLKKLHQTSVIKILYLQTLQPQSRYLIMTADSGGTVVRLNLRITTIFNKFVTTTSETVLFENEKEKKKFFSSSKKADQERRDSGTFATPSICYDIAVLSKIISKEHFGINQFSIVAIYFSDKGLLILKVSDDEFSVLTQFDLPYRYNKLPPILEWGDAIQPQSQTTNVVLLIGWGYNLFLIQCELAPDTDPNGKNPKFDFSLVGQIKVSSPIVYCNFISQSIIVTVSPISQQMSLYHTTEFTLSNPPPSNNGQDSPKKGDKVTDFQTSERVRGWSFAVDELEIKIPSVSIDITTPLEIEEFDEKSFQLLPRRLYHTSMWKNEVIVLTGNTCIGSRLQSWEEYFNNITKRGEWIRAMQHCLLTYEGKFQFLGQISSQPETRQKEMSEFSQKLSLTYIMMQSKQHELVTPPPKHKRSVSVMVNSKSEGIQSSEQQPNASSTITQTRKLSDSARKQEEKDQQEKDRTNSTSSNVSTNLSSNGSPDMENKQNMVKIATQFLLQSNNNVYLFSSFYNAIEAFGLKEIFMLLLEQFIRHRKIRRLDDNSLSLVLNYLNEKKKLDLIQKFILHLELTGMDISPLLRTCMQFNLYRALIYICSQIGDFLTPLIKLFMKYQETKQKKIGYLCLWYVRLCLQRKLISQEAIVDPEHEILMLQSICLFALIPENLRTLMLLDASTTFEILYILFEPQTIEIFLLTPDKFRTPDLTNYDPSFFDQSSFADLPIPQQIFSIIAHSAKITFKELENLTALFNIFCSRVIELDIFQFKVEKRLEILTFFFHSSEVSLLIYNENKLIKENQKDLIISPLFNKDNDEKEAQQNEIIITLLKLTMPDIYQSEIITKLISYCENSLNFQAICFLYHFCGNYSKCLDTYLRCPNRVIQEKVFNWLENVLESQQENNQAKIDDFKEAIMKQMQSLITINQRKALSMIQQHFQNNEVKLLGNLNAFPDEQLKVLDEILNNSNRVVNDNLKEIHLGLLCKYQKERVLSELKKRQYPLDATLSLCQQHDVQDAYAYKLSKSGGEREAVQIYIQIFSQILGVLLVQIRANTNEGPDYANSNKKEKKILSSHFKISIHRLLEANGDST